MRRVSALHSIRVLLYDRTIESDVLRDIRAMEGKRAELERGVSFDHLC